MPIDVPPDTSFPGKAVNRLKASNQRPHDIATTDAADSKPSDVPTLWWLIHASNVVPVFHVQLRICETDYLDNYLNKMNWISINLL